MRLASSALWIGVKSGSSGGLVARAVSEAERSDTELSSASFFYFKRTNMSDEVRIASLLASLAALLEIIDNSSALVSICLFSSSLALSTSALPSCAVLDAYSPRSYLSSSFTSFSAFANDFSCLTMSASYSSFC